ncbi:Uncharacterised protein [Salmonella enterica subsp. enterica serovar Typhimurium str. DT104]|nr:Uncharacterised protein [Salmonella enterica subsp. enterica serovar Typhimurium str. DT104]
MPLPLEGGRILVPKTRYVLRAGRFRHQSVNISISIVCRQNNKKIIFVFVAGRMQVGKMLCN